MHVVTANKGPLAHAFASLRDESAREGLMFRFESAVMDGAPVFSIWHNGMPGVKVLGFSGSLNSTSKIVIQTMEQGGSFEQGLAEARAMGVTEGDGRVRRRGLGLGGQSRGPGQRADGGRGDAAGSFRTRGITRLTPERMQEINQQGKTVRLITRGKLTGKSVSAAWCAPRCWSAPTCWHARPARRTSS
jgi:homoserine dehydrogenase